MQHHNTCHTPHNSLAMHASIFTSNKALQQHNTTFQCRHHRPMRNKHLLIRATRDDTSSPASTKRKSNRRDKNTDTISPSSPPAVGWLWQNKQRSSSSSPSSSSITRQSLKEQNIKPKKSLGQNFMIDQDVLQSITKAAHLSLASPVIEVGPGTGALTQYLIDSGACIIAVEKDYNLYDRLVDKYSDREYYGDRLRFICGDILRQDLNQLLDDVVVMSNDYCIKNNNTTDNTTSTDNTDNININNNNNNKAKIVANLPYYITKDFLNQSLSLGDKASSLVLMLQDEVAARLTKNSPGSTTWRAMNIIVEYYSNPKYLFRIDKKKYIPSPKVDGAVVEFILKSPEERISVPNEKQFLMFVKKAFLQRRKVLRNSLQPLVSAEIANEAMIDAGLSVDARAHDLSLYEFVKLAWSIDKLSGSN